MRGKPQEALTHGQRGNPHRSPEPAPAININRAHTGCLQWHYRSVRWKKTSESSTLYDTCRKRLVYIHETRLNADRLVFGLYPPYPTRSWLPTTIRIILIQRERENIFDLNWLSFGFSWKRKTLFWALAEFYCQPRVIWFECYLVLGISVEEYESDLLWLNDICMKYSKWVIYYFK